MPSFNTYVNKVLLEHDVTIHLYNVYGYFHTTILLCSSSTTTVAISHNYSTLNSCNTNHMTHKV